jgi:rhomboid family GlyGly-CTERM serine protease
VGRGGAPPHPLRTAAVTLLLAAPALLAALSPTWTAWLAWSPDRVAAGEPWRLLSGHWTHWSFDHLRWDLLVFLVVVPLCHRVGPARMWATLVASAVTIPLAVGWLLPGITEYRGLSGLDSALFVLLATRLLCQELAGRSWRSAVPFAAALALFLAKAGFELATGSTVFVAGGDFVPVPLAHIVGAVCGGLIGSWPRASGSGRSASDRRAATVSTPTLR